MLIRFTADAVYETEGRGKGPRFAAGEVHDMRDDLAQRWVNRGVAEFHVPEPAAVAPVAPLPDAPSQATVDGPAVVAPIAPVAQAPRRLRGG
jgi:hypothetical protein